jgi:hypothetical protein
MKEKLQIILNSYLNQHIDRKTMAILNLKLKKFFKEQHLEELQFRVNVLKELNRIEIKGIRLIDDYALIGIMK